MNKNRIVVFAGLALALSIAAFLSPFASKDPDGLDRASKDLKFEEKAATEPTTKQLPFSQIFSEYSFKAITDEKVSTALAGVTGTLVVFGLAWGIGKLTVRNSTPKE
ncbi:MULTISPECIES: PDGLE domain-containing protein [Pseudanabaena]|uniref:PDGLE domain-containing protein n=2 Tax=Pseudanabaena TaxID=1152 RepID=A0A9X4RK24_9CYAN|nr:MULTISPECIES: PDGLE domain-containing protein [Pseudanabaena]ELS30646.1 putative cobalt transport protein [Pseudanabaena biceps PCC 7429]MDG3497082.1 PDGLE domain-containing protein [Pseudanabaena catenata USMAC16]